MHLPPLVLLAPSESKAVGGGLGRLVENSSQAWVRRKLQALARNGGAEALVKAFGLQPPALQLARAEALALGSEVPLLPALERYTGVAFQALSPGTLDRRLWENLWILSPLRGLERGDQPVPPYRLKLGSLPGLREHWRTRLPALLAGLPDGVLWDLLPADHSQLLRDSRRPRHTVEIRSSRGVPVSHAAKRFRGLLAGWMLRHRQGDPAKVLRGRIDGCVWAGMGENDSGGVKLYLEVP